MDGYIYQVLNRDNGRLQIFRKIADFEAFEAILTEGIEPIDMRICGYCITSNHWHLNQGCDKSFPIQNDVHYLTVLRYIEANPLRAKIINSITRGAPLGDEPWVKQAAAILNLESTIKPRGRSRKST